MPRRARLVVPGIPWHIIQRGNNRTDCFCVEADYTRYLGILREQADKHGCAVHAYVLMTNHVHLLLTPAREESASLLMKHLGQRYVQYFNRAYRRSGTLWEGRFRSCLTRDERYVLGCYRYIELNPVRAAMVGHPREYRWSSYQANAEGRHDSVITPHPDYLRLGSTDASRREHYRALFQGRLDADTVAAIRNATNGNYALGSRQFQDEIGHILGRRVVRGQPGKRPRQEG
jgi:putative transposase